MSDEFEDSDDIDPAVLNELLESGRDDANKYAERQAWEEFNAAVLALNREYATIKLGGPTWIMQETTDADGRPITLYMRESDLRLDLRHLTIRPPGGYGKHPLIVDLWLRHPERRHYLGETFRPGEAIDPRYYNPFRGWGIVPAPGDCSLYKQHLLENICNGNQEHYDWLFAHFANIFQRPAAPNDIAVALRGPSGTGKTTVGKYIGKLLAAHYVPVINEELVVGRFSGHLNHALLLQIDDVPLSHDRATAGVINGLISGRGMFGEDKNKTAARRPNYLRILLTTNEAWAIPANAQERRWCVLDIGTGKMQNHAFFAAMDRQMETGGCAALLHEFLQCDLGRVNLLKAPQTPALAEQKLHSMRPEERWLYEQLYEGAQVRGGTWQTEIPKGDLYADYAASLDLVGERRKRWETDLGLLIKKMIPSVRSTRPLIKVGEDRSGRPVVRQVRCWRYPDLKDCRDEFEASAGVGGWPADE